MPGSVHVDAIVHSRVDLCARSAVSRWLGIREEDGTYHVVPVNDLIEHERIEDCVCGPKLQLIRTGPDVWMISHNSLDGRERDE